MHAQPNSRLTSEGRHSMLDKFFDRLRYLVGTSLSRSYAVKTDDGRSRPIFHRGTRADRGVVKQIFLRKDYSLKKMQRRNDLLAAYNAIIAANKTPLIIDAGANIGASVVWFANDFPQSHIVAIEPDADNVKLLRQNAEGLDVEILEAALGSTDGRVSLVDAGHGEWGYQTKDDATGTCLRVAASRIIEEKIAQGYAPFLFKIDIEGGEDNLFEAHTEWVDLFPLIIIELHDWLLPRGGTSFNFIHRMGQSRRDFVYRGENIFSIRND